MGNNIGGGSGKGKAAKVMKINGEIFKIKTPTIVRDVIKDYPNHVLLDSNDFMKFHLRASPLDPAHELRSKRLYLLVELPKFPSPLRRVQSGVRESRREVEKVAKRSVSDLSITTRSTASTDSDDVGSPMGPGRVKLKLPKAVVQRIMVESRDEVEVAERIIRLYFNDGE